MSIVMTCFEKMMVTLLRREVDRHLDSFQFACKQGGGTDDAINRIAELVSKQRLCTCVVHQLQLIST